MVTLVLPCERSNFPSIFRVCRGCKNIFVIEITIHNSVIYARWVHQGASGLSKHDKVPENPNVIE